MIQNNPKIVIRFSMLVLLFAVSIFGHENRRNGTIGKPYFNSGPSLIFHNANIITMDDSQPTAEAVAIENNRITAVGADADILVLAEAGTQVVDLEGRTILPGLIEGHSHIFQHGYQNDGFDGLRRVAEEMAAMGFTTVHDMNLHDPGLLNAARELASRGELAVRINFYPNYGNPDGSIRDDGWWQQHPYTTIVDTLIRIVGVKIYSDGGVSGVPAVSVPYMGGSNAGSYGDCWYSQSECNSIVREIHEAGYPIAVHCLGDSGVGVFVNAFNQVFGGQGNTLRHRFEHCRVMREDLTDRLAELGLVASIQYCWARQAIAEIYEGRYYPEVLQWIYPWQSMLDSGVRLVGGNDWPYTAHQQAMHVISMAATRKDDRNETLASWLDGNQISIRQAIQSMTTDAAWVCFEENEKGTVTAGKLADLTILSHDPLSTDPFDVRFITPEMTVMDGVIRYNQLGNVHMAVHDAGTFNLGIDDRGYWGKYRALVGMKVGSEEYLGLGSLLLAYDSGVTSTALYPQFDYTPAPEGSIRLMEPGDHADEEIQVIFEDIRSDLSSNIRITQKSLMWESDSCALINYTFFNAGSSNLADMYVAQFMDFDILGWRNAVTWELTNELGFACINNPEYDDGPFIGMAMFDTTDSHVNTSALFPRPGQFFYQSEGEKGDQIRSGIMETQTDAGRDRSIVLGYGPMSLEQNESKSPFTLVLALSKTKAGLRQAIEDAHNRILSLNESSAVMDENREKISAGEIPFYQCYPNPFNESTTIRFNLSQAGNVTLDIIDLMGRRVDTLLDAHYSSGEHSVTWNAAGFPTGVYVVRLKSSGIQQMNKIILQR